jgi:DNA-binding transcriptional MocR family regulator
MTNRATSSKLARSSATRTVIAELGAWATGLGPVFRQLARAVAGAIERGALGPGARLPSERALARALAVSRGTAVAAYDVLVSDGLIERRLGSGTFVGSGWFPGLPAGGLPAGREGTALVHRLVDQSSPAAGGPIDLSLSVLHDAHGLPAAQISTSDLTTVEPATGYSPWGLPALREALAAHVSAWGLPSSTGQIVVTTGAQQAIAAAAACWVRAGDTVVVDVPSYPGAIAAFAQSGARLVGVEVDRHGARPDSLQRALDTGPALVYLQSTLHSPTGAVLASSRRDRIAELIAAARVPLVEDVALADLCWSRAPAPIAARIPDASVAVVGSLSKLFWGGLRVGFVRAPPALALRFARVKATHDLGSSAVSEMLALRLLTDPSLPAFMARRIADLHAQYETLASGLRGRLPSWTWPQPEGGLSIWVRLPAGSGLPSAEEFARVALRHGVAVATAAPLVPDDPAPFDDRLRLSFSAPAEVLSEAAERLAAAWEESTRWR